MAISTPAGLMSSISSIREEDKAGMEAFWLELTEAVENGTFNAETMVGSFIYPTQFSRF